MKIGFYNPYFDSMSGGERYVLTLASHWSRLHDVVLFWDDPRIVSDSEKRLHIDLSRVGTVENVFKTKNVFKKLAVSSEYDLLFFLTDGSVPTTFARRNILHFQVPFASVDVHPIKLTRFGAIVCNSRFTKEHIDPRIGKRSLVIYPPVEPIRNAQSKKKNIILSVGRFHPVKKQDLLIEIFRKAVTGLPDFTLVLAGGLQSADKEYFESLRQSAKGLPVQFFPNVPFDTLTRLYNESLMYWHAAGYGQTKPEHMEHFGITTVEAMSAGCIPVVYNGGGLPEIIQTNLWNTPDECLAITQQIISHKATHMELRKKMITQSKKFSVETFIQAFDTLFEDITR